MARNDWLDDIEERQRLVGRVNEIKWTYRHATPAVQREKAAKADKALRDFDERTNASEWAR